MKTAALFTLLVGLLCALLSGATKVYRKCSDFEIGSPCQSFHRGQTPTMTFNDSGQLHVRRRRQGMSMGVDGLFGLAPMGAPSFTPID